MMTKPAAVFSQLAGVILVLLSISYYTDGSNQAGTLALVSGLVLFVLGGLATRKRVRAE